MPVLVLLAVGGLMRPEAWALAGLYTLYLWRGADTRERVTYAALTALAPVLWALGDWLVTGDPLHSLHGTAELAATVDRRRDPLTGPYWAAQYLGYTLREPLVIGIAIGLVFAWRHARRRALLPFAVAVAMLVVFLASPVFGLPLIGRYVRTPAVLLAVFYGLAVFGWQMLPPGAASAAYGRSPASSPRCSPSPTSPGTSSCSTRLDDRLVFQGSYYRDLREAGQDPAVRAALERCGTIATADHRPIPHLRWWTRGRPRERRPGREPEARGARVLLLPRRTRAMRRFYSVKFPRVAAPPGFEPVYSNASWRAPFAGASPPRHQPRGRRVQSGNGTTGPQLRRVGCELFESELCRDTVLRSRPHASTELLDLSEITAGHGAQQRRRQRDETEASGAAADGHLLFAAAQPTAQRPTKRPVSGGGHVEWGRNRRSGLRPMPPKSRLIARLSSRIPSFRGTSCVRASRSIDQNEPDSTVAGSRAPWRSSTLRGTRWGSGTTASATICS